MSLPFFILFFLLSFLQPAGFPIQCSTLFYIKKPPGMSFPRGSFFYSQIAFTTFVCSRAGPTENVIS